jgi:hypothetical protein
VSPYADRLLQALQRYAGWGYRRGVSTAVQDADGVIDCSSLTGRALCDVEGERYGSELYEHVVVYAERYAEHGWLAPIVGVERHGVGVRASLEDVFEVGEAVLVQEVDASPHAFVMFYAGGGLWWLVESTDLQGAGVSLRVRQRGDPRVQVPLPASGPLPADALFDASLLPPHYLARLTGPAAVDAVSPGPASQPGGPGSPPGSASAVAPATPTTGPQGPQHEGVTMGKRRRDPIERKFERVFGDRTDEVLDAIRANTENDKRPGKSAAEVVEEIAEYAEPGEVVNFLAVCAEALRDGFQFRDVVVIGRAALALVSK